MAEAQLTFPNVSDVRFDPFANGGTGEYDPTIIGWGVTTAERRLIPNAAPYVIKLYETPQLNLPSTTKITLVVGGTQLFEVSRTTSPAALQYRVIYYDDKGAGEVEFNSAQAGLEVDINYYALGTTSQKKLLELFLNTTDVQTFAGIKTFEDSLIIDDITVIGDDSITFSTYNRKLDLRGHLTGSLAATDGTTKNYIIGCNRYSNTNEPFIGMSLRSSSTTNLISFGGTSYTSEGVCANAIEFYTSAGGNTVATGGDIRLYITDVSGIYEIGFNTKNIRRQVEFRTPFLDGGSNESDTTQKVFEIACRDYTNNQTPHVMIYGSNTNTNNSVVIGGGSSSNAATDITFRTAANKTTATGTEVLRITSGQKISTGAELAPDCDTYGMTFHIQSGYKIITAKKNGVAHGMTTLAETDTCYRIETEIGGEGGFFLKSFGTDDRSVYISAFAVNAGTTDASIVFDSWKKSGTSATVFGARQPIFIFKNGGGVAITGYGDGCLDLSVGSAILKRVTGNSTPPTDAELDSDYGQPATVGEGFVAFSDNYLVFSNGTNWYQIAGTLCL